MGPAWGLRAGWAWPEGLSTCPLPGSRPEPAQAHAPLRRGCSSVSREDGGILCSRPLLWPCGEQRLALGLSEGILPLPLGPGLCSQEGIWPWMGWELLGPAQCLPLLLGSRQGRGGAAGA